MVEERHFWASLCINKIHNTQLNRRLFTWNKGIIYSRSNNPAKLEKNIFSSVIVYTLLAEKRMALGVDIQSNLFNTFMLEIGLV